MITLPFYIKKSDNSSISFGCFAMLLAWESLFYSLSLYMFQFFLHPFFTVIRPSK